MDIIASGVEKKLVFLCFLRHWALFTQNLDLDYFSKSRIQLFLLELFIPVLLNFRQVSSDYKLVDLDMPASHKYYKKTPKPNQPNKKKPAWHTDVRRTFWILDQKWLRSRRMIDIIFCGLFFRGIASGSIVPLVLY